MGYIRHQVSIAILHDRDTGAIAAINALRDEMADDTALVPQCIFGGVKVVNGYVSYAFLPDGSKEGWNTSDDADRYRERFIKAAKLAEFPDIVTLQMGGDDGVTRILFTTDEK